jgi:hypothetical protein
MVTVVLSNAAMTTNSASDERLVVGRDDVFRIHRVDRQRERGVRGGRARG